MKPAGCTNAALTREQTHEFCWPDREGRLLLEKAAEQFALSQRACDRTLRVARTIADLRQNRKIASSDVAEALTMREF